MPKDWSDLKQKMSLVVGSTPIVQIDIMDGRLTKDSTWPYKKNGDAYFDEILGEESGFPFWEEIDFEADLMVKNPEALWEDWIKAGAKRIVFHFESTEDIDGLLKMLDRQTFGKDSFLHTEIGLALDIDTPNHAIYPFIEKIDFIQCMGIKHIGSQGNPFDERVLEKIHDFKTKYPDKIISVDGGVNLETAPQLIEAGADRLIVGSAIFGSQDAHGALLAFKNLS